jgi:hypothetical protein
MVDVIEDLLKVDPRVGIRRSLRKRMAASCTQTSGKSLAESRECGILSRAFVRYIQMRCRFLRKTEDVSVCLSG